MVNILELELDLRSKVFNHDAVGDPLLFQPSLFIKLKEFES